MKLLICILFLVGLLHSISAKAQGTTFFSNLGPVGNVTDVASDCWRAASFVTGTDTGGYQLNSIQLKMSSSVGSPSGFAVRLYSASGVLPGETLGDLVGLSPQTGGVYTYGTSSLSLSPATKYFIVLTSETTLASGSFQWSVGISSEFSASNGWFTDGSYLQSPNGLNWSGYRPNPFQFAIDATAVPEPSTLALFCFSSLTVGALLFRRAKVKT